MHHHRRHSMEDRLRQGFEAMARRGFGGGRGFGGRFGDGADFGDTFRIGRLMASGDLRLVALYYIDQQPRHGYDLIKVIEERTSGLYSPSPGVIYPALTFLEEAGYVTAIPEGNKKAYQITDEGRQHLDENRAAVETTLQHLEAMAERWSTMREHMRDHMQHRDDPRDRDIPGAVPELNQARKAIKAAIKSAMRAGEDTQRRAAAVLLRAAAEIGGDDVDL